MDVWMKRLMVGWIKMDADEWTDGWMDGWMDG